MVRPLSQGLLCLAMIARGAQAVGGPPDPDPSRAVGRAMSNGSFPWYDAPRDVVRPIQVPLGRDGSASNGSTSSKSSPSTSSPSASPSSGGWDFGGWVSFAGFALAIGALVGLLFWFWRIYEPAADAELGDSSKSEGEPTRIDELPAGLRLGYDPSDPWAEAIRRRDQGDLAGAIVCLFAHQLLTLSRLGLLRISPGKTARQLLRSVSDAEYRGQVAPTLRLFEAAYYGHQPPSIEEFAAVWAGVEAFQRRVALGVAP
jgi:Domain of unknown function (DUF4129)